MYASWISFLNEGDEPKCRCTCTSLVCGEVAVACLMIPVKPRASRPRIMVSQRDENTVEKEEREGELEWIIVEVRVQVRVKITMPLNASANEQATRRNAGTPASSPKETHVRCEPLD